MPGWNHGKCKCCEGPTPSCGWSCASDDVGAACRYNGDEIGVATYYFEEVSGGLDIGPPIDAAYYQDQFPVTVRQVNEGAGIEFHGPEGFTSGAAPHGYSIGRPRAYISCVERTFPFERRLRGGVYNAMPTLSRPLSPDGGRYMRISVPSGIGSADQPNRCFSGGVQHVGVLISTCCWFYATSCPIGSTDGQAAIAQVIDGNRAVSYKSGVLYEDFRLTYAKCHPDCASQPIPSPSSLPSITGI